MMIDDDRPEYVRKIHEILTSVCKMRDLAGAMLLLFHKDGHTKTFACVHNMMGPQEVKCALQKLIEAIDAEAVTITQDDEDDPSKN